MLKRFLAVVALFLFGCSLSGCYDYPGFAYRGGDGYFNGEHRRGDRQDGARGYYGGGYQYGDGAYHRQGEGD
ncbi:hypothetical protein BI364_12925 [Acidihalobacter yilgarnensis]|uniref:Lipoprotein n=2 Tax=Acidihalobacter yilgarnensis TaxID=2819280 RepID=A0A1D8IQL8_9GAMM|nr:hypothetical protein BI364_12925 [Acidihalobacter yilgarnensis]